MLIKSSPVRRPAGRVAGRRYCINGPRRGEVCLVNGIGANFSSQPVKLNIPVANQQRMLKDMAIVTGSDFLPVRQTAHPEESKQCCGGADNNNLVLRTNRWMDLTTSTDVLGLRLPLGTGRLFLMIQF